MGNDYIVNRYRSEKGKERKQNSLETTPKQNGIMIWTSSGSIGNGRFQGMNEEIMNA
jgi:hypothetical protein